MTILVRSKAREGETRQHITRTYFNAVSLFLLFPPPLHRLPVSLFPPSVHLVSHRRTRKIFARKSPLFPSRTRDVSISRKKERKRREMGFSHNSKRETKKSRSIIDWNESPLYSFFFEISPFAEKNRKNGRSFFK